MKVKQSLTLKFVSVILLSILSVASVHAQPERVKFPSLNKSGFSTLKQMVTELRKICPEPDCGMLFIGRSNILLSAYLEAKGSTQVVNLPISGINDLASFTSKEKAAKKRFFEEVLEPRLKSKASRWRKAIVVDFVNEGDSIAVTANWIREYFKQANLSIDLEAVGYGNPIGVKPRRLLDNSGISYRHIFSGGNMSSGSPGFLAHQSQLENYAPYGQWKPLETESIPSYDSKLRRSYFYREPDGRRYYLYYASYDDIVESFKVDDWLDYTKTPGECSQSLHSFPTDFQ